MGFLNQLLYSWFYFHFYSVTNVKKKAPEQFKKSLIDLLPLIIMIIVIGYVTVLEMNGMVVSHTKLLIVFFGIHFGKLAVF